MVNIEINGKPVKARDGSTIMEAADQLGIYIPHFCYHHKLSIAANCRMCLVQVEKAPKPIPACASPVAEGMKVYTHSEFAVNAQKSVMEFLLINHPLDCPICDQGGECELQDLAMGYGGSASRYQEEKRVVVNKYLGPLVTTDMTRCIHCTRCVRFGQEIADVMELGMAGRGEHAEIMPFVAKTVDSELSGNIIDLCPVGALTSKPFRYSARSWELTRRPSVSPHCGLGSNLNVNVKLERVMRVLPRDNEEINECWLSDKDRFSYEGLNSGERLTSPMVKHGGEWRECEWADALEYAAAGLKQIVAAHGPQAVGALATPHQTLEELFLLQKLMRGLGSGNVDHRLRQWDFSADAELQGAPWLGSRIGLISQLDRFLVIGSTLRKDHPLLALKLRQAVKSGARMALINPVDDKLLVGARYKMIVAPGGMVHALAQVVKAVAEFKKAALPDAFAEVQANDAARGIAETLLRAQGGAILLGNIAQHHPRAAMLHALAQQLAALCQVTFGFLGEAANSVGAYIAGAVPMHGALESGAVTGLNARAMLASPRRGYVLLGVEAELDCYDPQQALSAMHAADLVVAMSAYRHRALEYAHVMLPIAPFSETSGSFVNTEGKMQSFSAVVKPLGDARPGWKVLRVMGNLLGVPGFDYDDSGAVRNEAVPGGNLRPRLNNRLKNLVFADLGAPPNGTLERAGEVPIYGADAIVRRAPSLQKTRDAGPPVAWMHGALLEKLKARAGDKVIVRQGAGSVELECARDDHLPETCVRVAAGHPLTAGLGGMFGPISVERV